MYRRTRTTLKIRSTDIQQTRHNYSQLTETEKAKFQTPFTYNDERNFVEHNPVKKISDDLVHPTKSDTSSVSDSIFSEERKEITEDVPAPADIPAPASALETVEKQPYTPGSRKSMRKNLGRPASTFSDLESIQMEHVQATSSEETNKCDIAEMNKIQIESRCTSVRKNVSEERPSNAKNLNQKMDGEDDVMYNINRDEYKKFCLAKLCDEELMIKLVEVLYESSTLEDFVKLITQLSEGSLDTMNMSFLLCLEVAKLQSLQTTTAMRFRKETKQFWEMVYRICHGKGLKLFSG